jgi:hypothetical protein
LHNITNCSRNERTIFGVAPPSSAARVAPTAADLNGNRGTQTVPEGAAETIRLALLPDDGPTGTYSDSQGIVPW